MRTNYITNLTDNTRCRILNDTTTYMASHFFKTECEVIVPNEDFTLVDEVHFDVSLQERVSGNLYVYEGDKTLRDMLFLVINTNGNYKMFYKSDYNVVVCNLGVVSKLRNKIVQASELILNDVNKDGLFVLDSPHGLLANKTKEEVLRFFESSGRVMKEILIRRNDDIEKLVIKETDYYIMVDNIVFNKKFQASAYEDIYPQIDTSELLDRVNLSVLIEDMNDVKVTSNGKVIVKNGKGIILKDKIKECVNTFEGYTYRIKEGLTFNDDVKVILERDCYSKITEDKRLLPIKDYFVKLFKENIFHLFGM